MRSALGQPNLREQGLSVHREKKGSEMERDGRSSQLVSFHYTRCSVHRDSRSVGSYHVRLTEVSS